MPTGRRETALITLVNQLDALDAKRRALVAEIQKAAGELGSGVSVPAARGGSKGGRRPGFKLSAEARAKIGAAQKRRWAKHKAEKKS
jgi:hypothetical protein